ncbi:MAG: hypothetical protein ACOY4O_13875 [Pseudomonadota bacterium]
MKRLTCWFPAGPERAKATAFKGKVGGKVNNLETTLAGNLKRANGPGTSLEPLKQKWAERLRHPAHHHVS